MKLSAVLRVVQESKSADLYHGTFPDRAETMLTTDTMIASAPVEPSAVRYMRGKARYDNKTVSLSRSMSAARSFASGSSRKTGIMGVIFVINQELLARDIGKRMTPYNDLYSSDPIHGNKRNTSTEYEEAVMGDINHINKYIKRIIVLVDPARKDLVDPQQFPRLLNDPRVELISGKTGVKDVGSEYDRFPTARETARKPIMKLSSTE